MRLHRMNEEELNLIKHVTKIVEDKTGNTFTSSNLSMVKSRLHKRILELRLSGPKDYHDYIKTNLESETKVLIGLLTTHHTFFFREYTHFETLKEILPQIVSDVKKSGRKTIKVWSAATSRGQEALSLSLFLDYHLKKINSDLDYIVYGSDVDPESIEIAKEGVYPYSQTKEIPLMYLKGYWLKGKKNNSEVAKPKSHIHQKCVFLVSNLMDPKNINEEFDIIFCRNVLIYFDPTNVARIVQNLLQKLTPNGHLVTGVSEPIGHLTSELEKIGPTFYTTKRNLDLKAYAVRTKKATNKKIKIVNVDDSPSVLKVLAKVFEKDDRFKVIGQCENGNKLKDFLQKESPDIITLDLHMPELDGVNYLKKYYNKNHPPVLIVSSVNRDNQELSQKALEYGAIDFVEKPSLQNFEKCSEEIINKIISSLEYNTEHSNQYTHQRTDKEIECHQSSLKVRNDFPSSQLTLSPLFFFCDSTNTNEFDHVLKELVERKLLPTAIVLPFLNETKEWKNIFQKYNAKQVYLYGIDDFLENFSKKLYSGNNVLCFFQKSGLINKLTSSHLEKNYILSENDATKTVEDINIMPYSSWGYHIYEYLNSKKSSRNSLLQYKKNHVINDSISPNEILLIFYTDMDTIASIYISNDINKLNLNIFRNNPISSYKIIGSSKLTNQYIKKIGNLARLEKNINRDTSFSFKISDNKARIQKVPETVPPPKTHTPITPQNNRKKAKVMIIDDSSTMSKILGRILEKEESITEISIVNDPTKAKEEISKFEPDVITLDINMPKMNGIEVYKSVIRHKNIPTVVVSSSLEESEDVLNLLQLGAVDYIQKPSFNNFDNHNFPLLDKIKLALKANTKNQIDKPIKGRLPNITDSTLIHSSLILIGSSTGGTRALHQVLGQFPQEFPPVIIAQHIPKGFSKSFAQQLNKNNPFEVVEAKDGDEIRPNTVFICPGSLNTSLEKQGMKYVLKVHPCKIHKHGIPSVDILFESSAKNFKGPITAAILTGMGKDGAQGMEYLKRVNSFNIAQDEKSCVVYGMPRAAVEKGVIDISVDLNDIPSSIYKSLHSKKNAA